MGVGYVEARDSRSVTERVSPTEILAPYCDARVGPASRYGVGINTYTTQYSDFTALDFAVLGFHLIVPTKLHERMNTLLGAPMGRVQRPRLSEY